MSRFKYSDNELEQNKILKMNQDISSSLMNDSSMADARQKADAAIESSVELLRLLGKADAVDKLSEEIQGHTEPQKLEHSPKVESWEELVRQANEYYPEIVTLEDIMTEAEINASFHELDLIEKEFSRRTSLVNKVDLSFLAIATALQVTKNLLFPYVAGKAGYGTAFDPNQRLPHDDKSIKKAHRSANDAYMNKHAKKNGTGYWINILYLTPPYDLTKGSPAAGLELHGGEHRLYTLGHDPVLGWLFGTMNILTDIITTSSFQSRRVIRKPPMITPEVASLPTMVQESYEMIKADRLNLPAAIFAQAQHLKSDKFTKMGLPVPVLAAINEQFASQLYKEHYDSLCFSRDIKIVGQSFVVSVLIDLIIGLVHGLFRKEGTPQKIYEVRTRKILLISNTIASASTIIHTGITANPRNLDIGGLLSTVSHLFLDTRFILKIQEEFIENEISKRLLSEIQEIDTLYSELV